MTAELAIVLAIRLIVPLSIFRWPLWGGVASLLADALDILLINLMPLDGAPNYHKFDKYPDTYYLTIEYLVALRLWPGRPLQILSALYVWRALGFVLFEVTGVRKVLFFCPNIFESFYLFMAIWDRFGRGWYLLTARWLVTWLAILGSLRLLQEYFLHWRQSLDHVVAAAVIEDVTASATGDWLAVTIPLLLLAAAVIPALVALLRRQLEMARSRAG